MSDAFYKLMRDLTESKKKIEANPNQDNHSMGFLRGFTYAGRMVWQHRKTFQKCSESETK